MRPYMILISAILCSSPGYSSPESICTRAQLEAMGHSLESFPGEVQIDVLPDQAAFRRSKPSIEGSIIRGYAYIPQDRERTTEYDEIWCKMKSAKAVNMAWGKGPFEPSTCKDILQAQIDGSTNTWLA